MNLMEAHQIVKGLGDADLAVVAGRPSGYQFLAVGEMADRARMRAAPPTVSGRMSQGVLPEPAPAPRNVAGDMNAARFQDGGAVEGLGAFAGQFLRQAEAANAQARSAYDRYMQTVSGLAVPNNAAERDKRIAQMETENAQRAAQDRAMALVQAGLGIAAGPSPDFFTNIARGGQVGLDALASARAAAETRGGALEQRRDAAMAAAQAAEMAEFQRQQALAQGLLGVETSGIDRGFRAGQEGVGLDARRAMAADETAARRAMAADEMAARGRLAAEDRAFQREMATLRAGSPNAGVFDRVVELRKLQSDLAQAAAVEGTPARQLYDEIGRTIEALIAPEPVAAAPTVVPFASGYVSSPRAPATTDQLRGIAQRASRGEALSPQERALLDSAVRASGG